MLISIAFQIRTEPKTFRREPATNMAYRRIILKQTNHNTSRENPKAEARTTNNTKLQKIKKGVLAGI